jgi:hypothetical protein
VCLNKSFQKKILKMLFDECFVVMYDREQEIFVCLEEKKRNFEKKERRFSNKKRFWKSSSGSSERKTLEATIM